MSKPLATAWSSHLSADKQQEFQDLVRNSTGVLTRLQEIVLQGGTSEDRRLITDASFDEPNFNEKMIFNLGKRAGENRILKLLSFLDP